MRYYGLDPDEGSYFVYMSDLNEEQKEYILTNIYPDYDLTEDDDDDKTYKYTIDAPCCTENSIFSNLIKYLEKEGFIELSIKCL